MFCYVVLYVPCSLVTTCWERVLLCVVFSCVLSLSHMVSWSGVVQYAMKLDNFIPVGRPPSGKSNKGAKTRNRYIQVRYQWESYYT